MPAAICPEAIAAALQEQWSPRVIGEVDDAYIKVAKIKGMLAWHSHDDEHELINVIVWRDVAEAQRRILLEARLLGVDGKWEMHDEVCHLVAARLLDMSPMLGQLDVRSRNLH